jgi:diadenosine tetraphosphate (Ap4A) HIT family hydrolase
VTDRAVEENELALAFLDGYPVTEGHTLIIPKRHVADYFDLFQPELNAIQQLLQSRQKALTEADPTIEGFNVGVNAGQVAGQTVFHCHIHLMPRRLGDMDDPKGGVRGVIPAKQKY